MSGVTITEVLANSANAINIDNSYAINIDNSYAINIDNSYAINIDNSYVRTRIVIGGMAAAAVAAAASRSSTTYRSDHIWRHNYIGHNYIGPKLHRAIPNIGHNCIGHDYIGYYYTDQTAQAIPT